MATCIDPQFIERVKSLNLAGMKSADRVKVLDDILGSGQGKDINLLYEKTLLLKNQKKAFDKFIDDISGMSLEKKAITKERIAQRLAEKQDIIKEDELLSIVKETLDKKYDLDIPDESVQKMFTLKNEADELAVTAKGTPDGSPEKLAWGKKIVELSNTVGELKQVSKNFLGELKLAGQRIAGQAKDGNYLGAVGQTLRETFNVALSPATKSIKASLDNSILFRQGLKVLSASPETFGNQGLKTWKMWGKVLSKDAMEEMSTAFKADLVTRDLYQSAIKSKLAIGVVEDFFPTSIVQKFPVLGNFFKASDEAFTMFSQGSRMDLFEKYVDLYKTANGGALPSKEIMDGFARVANSTTGRGGLGKLEASAHWLNQVFFSARYQTANINTFRHAFDTSLPIEAQKIARKQLAKHLVLVGGIMTTMSAFMDVGFDPKESTFGKVRIPGSKKWVDVTGGLASYFSVIGKTAKAVNSKPGYKTDTGLDIIVDFMKGKLAPTPGVLRDILEQRDYSGKKPTVGSVANSLFMPITIDNPIQDIKKDEEVGITALSSFLEFLGNSVTQPKSKGEGNYWSPLDIVR